jgi:hypothetical protein
MGDGAFLDGAAFLTAAAGCGGLGFGSEVGGSGALFLLTAAASFSTPV